jgi:uracil-DNA glycosylase
VGQGRAVKPWGLVAGGARPGLALLGRDFRVSRQRGELVDSPLAAHVLATVHPSAILRANEDEREAEYGAFVADLRTVARLL